MNLSRSVWEYRKFRITRETCKSNTWEFGNWILGTANDTLNHDVYERSITKLVDLEVQYSLNGCTVSCPATVPRGFHRAEALNAWPKGLLLDFWRRCIARGEGLSKPGFPPR